MTDEINLEEIGGWRKGTEWEERWLDRCQWYFARCQYNDWDDDEEILVDIEQRLGETKT